MAGIWEEFRWKRGDLAGFAGLVVVGRILLVAGALPALPAWRGYGKNSAGKGGTAPALPAWMGLWGLCAGKGMSSPALPAARALSLAAGPLQDKYRYSRNSWPSAT